MMSSVKERGLTSSRKLDQQPLNKKSKTKTKEKKNNNKKKGEPGAPVVKIPTSQKEASTNWKLLLSQTAKEKASQVEDKGQNPKKPLYLRRDVQRYKRQKLQAKMEDDVKNSNVVDNKATEGQGSNTSDVLSRAVERTKNLNMGPSPSTSSSSVGAPASTSLKQQVSFPKLNGLNSLGFFDYTHYGHLKTTMDLGHAFLTNPTPAVAIDCEMVGVGPLKEDALARVSIVNEFGYCLYDRFVKPKLEVTDYRTEFSGVREEDLKTAEDFTVVLQNVADLIKGKFLIGHSLKSDFDVLLLKHPKAKIRDTSFYYRRKFKRLKTPSLKMLVRDHLKVEIQAGEHNSITDAQAAMKLYLIMRDDWESSFGDKYNYRVNRYWMTHEYRKAFQAIGFTINLNVKNSSKGSK